LTDQVFVMTLPAETLRVGRDIPYRDPLDPFYPNALANLEKPANELTASDGVASLTVEDWRALDALSPDQRRALSNLKPDQRQALESLTTELAASLSSLSEAERQTLRSRADRQMEDLAALITLFDISRGAGVGTAATDW